MGKRKIRRFIPKKRGPGVRARKKAAKAPVVPIGTHGGGPRSTLRRNHSNTFKPGIMYTALTVDGNVNWSIAQSMAWAQGVNGKEGFPFEFGTKLQVGTRPVEYARNLLTEDFYNKAPENFEWLLMVDQDQVVPQDFWRLCLVGDADVVSGLTYTWMGRNDPACHLRVNQYGLNEKSQCYNLDVPPDVISKGTPYRIPIAGTGCIAIRRRVFAPPPHGLGVSPWRFTYEERGKTKAGEDINFSVDASQAGFVFTVMPSVKFGHVKELDIAQVKTWYDARHAADNAGIAQTPDKMVSIG